MSHDNNKWEKIKEASEMDPESFDGEVESDDTMSEPSHSKSTKKSKHDADKENELEHLDYEELEEKLTTTEQKMHDNWEKLVRMTAELDNVRRRAVRDVEHAHRYGSEKLITSLLPVLDSLEQAIQLVDEDSNPAMFEGLQLTMKLFLDTLAKQND